MDDQFNPSTEQDSGSDLIKSLLHYGYQKAGLGGGQKFAEGGPVDNPDNDPALDGFVPPDGDQQDDQDDNRKHRGLKETIEGVVSGGAKRLWNRAKDASQDSAAYLDKLFHPSDVQVSSGKQPIVSGQTPPGEADINGTPAAEPFTPQGPQQEPDTPDQGPQQQETTPSFGGMGQGMRDVGSSIYRGLTSMGKGPRQVEEGGGATSTPEALQALVAGVPPTADTQAREANAQGDTPEEKKIQAVKDAHTEGGPEEALKQLQTNRFMYEHGRHFAQTALMHGHLENAVSTANEFMQNSLKGEGIQFDLGPDDKHVAAFDKSGNKVSLTLEQFNDFLSGRDGQFDHVHNSSAMFAIQQASAGKGSPLPQKKPEPPAQPEGLNPDLVRKATQLFPFQPKLRTAWLAKQTAQEQADTGAETRARIGAEWHTSVAGQNNATRRYVADQNTATQLTKANGWDQARRDIAAGKNSTAVQTMAMRVAGATHDNAVRQEVNGYAQEMRADALAGRTSRPEVIQGMQRVLESITQEANTTAQPGAQNPYQPVQSPQPATRTPSQQQTGGQPYQVRTTNGFQERRLPGGLWYRQNGKLGGAANDGK